MKRPEQIDFETYDEFEDKMQVYKEHLTHEEWSRNGAKRAFNTWIIVLGSLIGLCVGGLALYKIISNQ